MKLIFIGRGAGFNKDELNTSAYFIEKNELFLIDCGEDIFKEILKQNLLDNINKLNVLITHTHSDHIGSLSNLILYTYYRIKSKVNILCGKDNKDIIDAILTLTGCAKDMYELIDEKEYENIYESFNSIQFINTKHSDYIPCYSILFNTKNGIVFYTGDTKETKYITGLLKTNNVDKIYTDVTNDKISSNVHIHVDELKEKIDIKDRKKIYCMHFNNSNCIKEVQELGFNIVQKK